MDIRPKHFIMDVDGVLTTGHFLYSEIGKQFKVFGPDDHDALVLLSPLITIHFITADKKGFRISKRRIVEDMSFPLDLVSSTERLSWVQERFDLSEVVFMGDGIFDSRLLSSVGYSIAPANADQSAKFAAMYTTTRSGGDRAVAEACLHLIETFFKDSKEYEYIMSLKALTRC